jgi:allantoinase
VSTTIDRVNVGDLVGTHHVLRDDYIAVCGEIMAAIGRRAPLPAIDTRDNRGRGRLTPQGLVDEQMHTALGIGWPGIESATGSAAAGGVRTCVDMPYDVTHPVIDAGKLADRIGWVKRTVHVDTALYGAILKPCRVGAIP